MTFIRGQSGNYNGARIKSPEQREFEAKCRQWCKEYAFPMLAKKAFSDDEKISTWALEALINRAFGKPVETAVIEANVTAQINSSAEAIASELAEIVGAPAIEDSSDDSADSVDAGK